MNKIAKIIVLYFSVIAIHICLLFCDAVSRENPENCKIEYNIYRPRDNIDRFEGNLIFTAPAGWKISKVPKVIVEKSNQNFKIRNKESRKISDLEYIIPFYLNINNDQNLKVKILIEIALCSDICTIVSKEIVIDCDRAQEIPNNSTFQVLWIMMLLGFFGGFILNLMPCVLPVILMKMRSFLTSSSNGKRSAILGTISGNYASFAAFTLILMLFKVAGEQVGWGMHFQNPYFLEAVAVVLFLLCLYSVGILQIPIFLQVSSKKRQIFWENFISSVIATIIAIPCTAPFLGTAATFAIQRPACDMAAVFFCISTGFSVPYLVTLLRKGEQEKEPKPFSTEKLHKYETFAKIVANAGAGITLAWILYLLDAHLGFFSISIILALFVTSAIFFVKKYLKVGAICLTAIFFIGYFTQNSENMGAKERQEEASTVLIKEILDGTNPVSQKRIVIINISADWCLTCKYNKINLLNSKKIRELTRKKNILYIEGDMTHKNDTLIQIIKDHGRIGIPFTIILGPMNREGVVLSEIPSAEEVREAILKVDYQNRSKQ